MAAFFQPAGRFLLLLGLAGVAAGCSKPKPGEHCEGNQRVCMDDKTSLLCVSAGFQIDPCKGKGGCVEEQGTAKCDPSGNAEGDPCPSTAESSSYCREDKKSRVLCKKSKYTIETCPGRDGCTQTMPGVTSCDHGPPKIGTPCFTERLLSCTEDHKSALVCRSGAFALAQNCPGPAGCTPSEGGLVNCDPNGVFSAGDACYMIAAACTADGSQMLFCEGGKLAAKDKCPGPMHCQPGGRCDTGIGKLGEPCPGVDWTACSDDKHALLACAPSKTDPAMVVWTKKKSCGSCTVADGKLACR